MRLNDTMIHMVVQNSTNLSAVKGYAEFECDLLTHYGTCIAQYYGYGILTVNGGEKLSCKFEAGQLNNGDAIMLCYFETLRMLTDLSESSFEGTTLEGYKLTANKAMSKMNYLPEIPKDRYGTWESIRWRYICMQIAEGDTASKIGFGITNFEFSGTEREILTDGENYCERNFCILPLNINNNEIFYIKKLRDYDKTMKRISTLKGIDVTCEIESIISKNVNIEDLKGIMDNLCYILSVARGTKIQWIYCNLYNNEGQIFSKMHFSRITKPYCPLPIIDPRIQGRTETKYFVETAYPIYTSKRDPYNLNRGIIDAYLAGKAEADFFEQRGLKLSVAIEMLKDVFLKTSDASIREFIIDEDIYEKFTPQICEGVRRALSDQIEEKILDMICCKGNAQKLMNLNRVSFKQTILDLCKAINFEPTKDDIKLFINCRNSLVHTGKFYCQTAKDKKKANGKLFQGPTHEYFFLVDFLDRIFLKFFNYSGAYICSRDLKFERNELT